MSGPIGLDVKTAPEKVRRPVRIIVAKESNDPDETAITDTVVDDCKVVDIASGDNHILILTEDGEIFSFGVNENGQLGRLSGDHNKFDLSTKELFLKPSRVIVGDDPSIKCTKIWAGAQSSFCQTTEGDLYAWGLNNYHQLGFESETQPATKEGPAPINETKPKNVTSHFPVGIENIAAGSHHTLSVDKEGRVYSNGRYHYGRLGHGDLKEDIKTPKLIESLMDEKIKEIACGGEYSVVVSSTGK